MYWNCSNCPHLQSSRLAWQLM